MNKQKLLVVTRWFVGAIALLTLVPAVMAVSDTGIVPNKYLGSAVPLYVVAVLVGAVLAIRRSWPKQWLVWVGVVASLLATAVNVAVYSYSQTTSQFIGSTQQAAKSYVEYSIVGLKGAATVLESAKTAGMVTNDQSFAAASKALSDETAATVSGHDNLTSVVEALTTQAVELVAVRSSSLRLVEENSPETYAKLEMLGTFVVEGDTQVTRTVDTTKPFVAYISGIDTYGDVATTSRSDVNIVVVMNPQKRTMLLVNTPRDYYVQLHGTSGIPDKLTHAGIYGIDMSRQTLQDLYGVDIPLYVRLNFTSLVRVIDTIGPIQVQSDYAFKSYHEGMNTLDSTQALEFARERYSFQAGDRQRGRNQQRVVEAVVAKLSEPSNIIHYNTLLKELDGVVQTNADEATIKKLVSAQLDDMKRWKIESVSVDGTSAMLPTYSMGAQPLYVMQPDAASVDSVRAKIQGYLK